MVVLNDTFNRSDTSVGAGLGSVPSGGPAWEIVAGTGWRILSNRAYTTESANPITAVSTSSADIDASLDVGTGGDALYFRVVDASNWWRIRTDYYTTSSTSNYTYVGPWSAYANGNVVSQPINPNPTYSDYYDGYPRNEFSSYAIGGGNHQYRSRTRTVETRSSTSYYPVYSVRLEKSVAGSVTNSGTYGSSSAKVRALTDGSAISWYRWTGSAWALVSTVTDSSHLTATKHGVGRGASSNNSTGMDNFTVDTLNTAPNAPGSLSPDGATTIDKDVAQRFAWVFSDPDSGDSQTKYDLRYQVVGAGTWTDTSGTTANQFRDFAGGTFAAGDYEWQVRTYDAGGIIGPYSTSATFTAAESPDGPTITDPINGGTVGTDPYTVTWSTPDQDAYQVRTVADAAGSPDAGTIYQDTGIVESTPARSRSITFNIDSRTEHVQVRVRLAGLWSAYTSVSVSVSYTLVATPELYVFANDAGGGVSTIFSNPTPIGDEPLATTNELWVRVAAGGRQDGQRTVNDDGIPIVKDIGNNGAFTDYAAGIGTEYEYRGRAIGANGTRTFSDWT